MLMISTTLWVPWQAMLSKAAYKRMCSLIRKMGVSAIVIPSLTDILRKLSRKKKLIKYINKWKKKHGTRLVLKSDEDPLWLPPLPLNNKIGDFNSMQDILLLIVINKNII